MATKYNKRAEPQKIADHSKPAEREKDSDALAAEAAEHGTPETTTRARVDIKEIDDDAFAKRYGGAFQAECKNCGWKSETRSSEMKANIEGQQHDCKK